MDIRKTTLDGGILGHVSYDVQLTWFGWNRTGDEVVHGLVFVAEEGWFDSSDSLHDDLQRGDGGRPQPSAFVSTEVPIVLGRVLLPHDFAADEEWSRECPMDIDRRICKSKHSICLAVYSGYRCGCDEGFDGSPYVTDGCQEREEGNFAGNFECSSSEYFGQDLEEDEPVEDEYANEPGA